jgi:hypothetical protein
MVENNVLSEKTLDEIIRIIVKTIKTTRKNECNED